MSLGMAYGKILPSSGRHQQLQSLAPMIMLVCAAKVPKVIARGITGSNLNDNTELMINV